jgi:hypothetical protein
LTGGLEMQGPVRLVLRPLIDLTVQKNGALISVFGEMKSGGFPFFSTVN